MGSPVRPCRPRSTSSARRHPTDARRAVRSATFAAVCPSVAQTSRMAARSNSPANTPIRRRSCCSRELDGQREAVDSAADLSDEITGAICIERRLCPGTHSLPEQAFVPHRQGGRRSTPLWREAIVAHRRPAGPLAGTGRTAHRDEQRCPPSPALLLVTARIGVDFRAARISAYHRQRGESVTHLVHHPQRLSTRCEHTKARKPAGEALDEVGHR